MEKDVFPVWLEDMIDFEACIVADREALARNLRALSIKRVEVPLVYIQGRGFVMGNVVIRKLRRCDSALAYDFRNVAISTHTFKSGLTLSYDQNIGPISKPDAILKFDLETAEFSIDGQHKTEDAMVNRYLRRVPWAR